MSPVSVKALIRRLAAIDAPQSRGLGLTTQEARVELVALMAEAKGLNLDDLDDEQRAALLELARRPNTREFLEAHCGFPADDVGDGPAVEVSR